MGKLTYERPIITPLNSGMTNKFGSRTEYRPMTHIDHVAVKDLLADYGSPLFVFSEQKIRDNFKMPSVFLKPDTLKCNLPGRIKPII